MIFNTNVITTTAPTIKSAKKAKATRIKGPPINNKTQ